MHGGSQHRCADHVQCARRQAPPLSTAQLQNIGVKLLCYPLSSTLMYSAALRTLGKGLLEAGIDQSAVPVMPVGEYETVLGIREYA